jgi:hypothetical protein
MKKLIIPAFVLTVVQSTASAAPGTASGPSDALDRVRRHDPERT